MLQGLNIKYRQSLTPIVTWFKKSPLIFKLFLSLALFIIIPVTILSIVSNYMILHFAETEISKSGIGKLKVARSLTELIAEGVSKDALHLALNTDLNRINNITRYNQVLKNSNHMLLLIRFSDFITEMVNSNDKYQSISLYLDDADYVFSSVKESNQILRKQEYIDTDWLKYYREFVTYSGKTMWLKTRVFKNSNIYIPKSSSGTNSTDYVITYMYPLTPYITKIRGAFIINLYESKLRKLINSNNSITEGYISIITPEGDVISHADKKWVGKNIGSQKYIRKIGKGKSGEGYLITDINNQKSLVTYLKTDFNNWIYVGVFPLDSLMNKVTALRMGALYAAVILVLIGLFLSFLISSKLYHPVKKLIQDIQNHKGIDIHGNESEMALIAKAFDTIIQQEDLLSDTLEKNKRQIRDNCLLGLLKDTTPQDQGLDVISEIFPYPYFVCALIAIDKYEEFTAKYPKEQQYYLKVLILKVSEEILNSTHPCTGLVLEREKIGLIINISHNDSQILGPLKENLVKVQSELAKICDNTISVAIGNCYEGKNGIKSSFYEAQETLKLKLTQGYARINIWQAGYLMNKKYFYPFTIEKHILNYLDLGLKQETLAAINDLIAELKNRTDLSYDNIILIFNQLLGNTVKYLVESRQNISDVFGEDNNIYQQLATKETLDDIKEWLIHIYTHIFAYRERSLVDHKTHFNKIMDYIQQNYKKDIDINTLADHVGLSYSHVRKIFHDETGENIVNYINNYRINEAKRLLCETDLNINEIALGLGYNNDQSFNRFFKKYEGITPGEYRKIKNR